jgi:8-oxo-dGTP pyrophosphatase MutT (NUDIX family)
MSQQDFHKIQIEILLRLMQSPKSLTFSDLLPEELKLESYKFNYHLKQLVKDKLVDKLESGYKLTEKGLNLISVYTVAGEVDSKHKVSVALAAFRTNKNIRELLMQKRLRHPFYGDVTTIAGKVKLGEKILDAAKRKLTEEAGLEGDFRLVGILRKCKYNQEGKLLEDTFYHYCVAEDPKGELVEINEHGENFWTPTEHAMYIMKDNIDLGPEDKAIAERLLANDFSWFFTEQDQKVREYTRE